MRAPIVTQLIIMVFFAQSDSFSPLKCVKTKEEPTLLLENLRQKVSVRVSKAPSLVRHWDQDLRTRGELRKKEKTCDAKMRQGPQCMAHMTWK